MTPRDTSTGAVLEKMIAPALERGGYRYQRQVDVGERPGGGRHKVDLVAYGSDGTGILVSLKWQQVSGTAEQKVFFEVSCLAHAVRTNPCRYRRAYLVLGGPGWKLRDFYTSGGLANYIKDADLVTVLSLEDFVARANAGTL